MRIILCCLFPLLLAFVAVVIGAPVDTTDSAAPTVTDKPDCNGEHAEFYDQRQNGTENYRIHLNGVVVLVAPAETVFQAAQLAHLESELEGVMSEGSVLKPKPRPPSPSEKVPGESHETQNQAGHQSHYTKDVKENQLKLVNLLHMFRSINHDVEGASSNLKR